jgi:hypothetical protein
MPHLDKKIEWIYALLFHMLVVAGVVILALGASDLQKPNPKPSDQTLIKAGISILTASWVILVGLSAGTLISNNHHAKSGTAHRDGTLVRISDSKRSLPTGF